MFHITEVPTWSGVLQLAVLHTCVAQGAASQNGAVLPPWHCHWAWAFIGTHVRHEKERIILIFKTVTSFQKQFFHSSCPEVIPWMQKKKNILTFFWKADSEWKVSSRNNLNSVRHQLRAFPQPFCSSSPPLTQPKNCWSYKKWLFLWEHSPNISRQCVCQEQTTYPTLSSRYKNLAGCISKQFHQNNTIALNPYQRNSGRQYFR